MIGGGSDDGDVVGGCCMAKDDRDSDGDGERKSEMKNGRGQREEKQRN